MAIERITGKLTSATNLTSYVANVLTAAGADATSAEATARALVDASARGVDSHGVPLAPWYVQMVEGGRVNWRPNVTFALKGAAVGHVDSDNGFGHRASYRAIDEGCALAEKNGVAAITVGAPRITAQLASTRSRRRARVLPPSA
jgi:ureidoglycolate dehydrogenase (NAD+)